MFTLHRIIEVGCSVQNLLKGAELKPEQQNMLRQQQQKNYFLARGQISVSAFKEVFYGRGQVILWRSPKISSILGVLSHHS